MDRSSKSSYSTSIPDISVIDHAAISPCVPLLSSN